MLQILLKAFLIWTISPGQLRIYILLNCIQLVHILHNHGQGEEGSARFMTDYIRGSLPKLLKYYIGVGSAKIITILHGWLVFQMFTISFGGGELYYSKRDFWPFVKTYTKNMNINNVELFIFCFLRLSLLASCLKETYIQAHMPLLYCILWIGSIIFWIGVKYNARGYNCRAWSLKYNIIVQLYSLDLKIQYMWVQLYGLKYNMIVQLYGNGLWLNRLVDLTLEPCSRFF